MYSSISFVNDHYQLALYISIGIIVPSSLNLQGKMYDNHTKCRPIYGVGSGKGLSRTILGYHWLVKACVYFCNGLSPSETIYKTANPVRLKKKKKLHHI